MGLAAVEGDFSVGVTAGVRELAAVVRALRYDRVVVVLQGSGDLFGLEDSKNQRRCHTALNTRASACAHARTHTHTRTRTHTHTYTPTLTHKHIRTHTPVSYTHLTLPTSSYV